MRLMFVSHSKIKYQNSYLIVMIVVLLSYSLPRSPFCLITQGALRDETKRLPDGEYPMITRGNL